MTTKTAPTSMDLWAYLNQNEWIATPGGFIPLMTAPSKHREQVKAEILKLFTDDAHARVSSALYRALRFDRKDPSLRFATPEHWIDHRGVAVPVRDMEPEFARNVLKKINGDPAYEQYRDHPLVQLLREQRAWGEKRRMARSVARSFGLNIDAFTEVKVGTTVVTGETPEFKLRLETSAGETAELSADSLMAFASVCLNGVPYGD